MTEPDRQPGEGTWDTSLRIMGRLRPLMAVAFIGGVVFASLDMIFPGLVFISLATSAFYAVISYIVFVHFLSGEKTTGTGWLLNASEFSFKTFVMVSVFLTTLTLLMDRIGMVLTQSDTQSVTGPSILLALIYLFAMGRYGTILPAIVAQTDTSLSAAAGRSDTMKVAWRLFLVTGVGFCLTVIPATMLATFAVATGGAPAFMSLVAVVFASIFALWFVVASSVVLGKAFRGAYRS